jgi:hypothetical protein
MTCRRFRMETNSVLKIEHQREQAILLIKFHRLLSFTPCSMPYAPCSMRVNESLPSGRVASLALPLPAMDAFSVLESIQPGHLSAVLFSTGYIPDRPQR